MIVIFTSLATIIFFSFFSRPTLAAQALPPVYSKSFQNNKHSHDQNSYFSQTTQKSQKSAIISQIPQNLQAQSFTKSNKLQTAPAYSHNVSAYLNEISTNLLPLFTPICAIIIS